MLLIDNTKGGEWEDKLEEVEAMFEMMKKVEDTVELVIRFVMRFSAPKTMKIKGQI